MYWMGQMPPKLPLVHKLDESLAMFKNELLAVNLLEPDKDWYDYEYTKTSEIETIKALDRLDYIFNKYDEDGSNKCESYDQEGKVIVKPIIHNPEVLATYPTLFPFTTKKDTFFLDGRIAIKGNSYLVYTGEVLKKLFTEHKLTPELITHESYKAYLTFLQDKLLNDKNVLPISRETEKSLICKPQSKPGKLGNLGCFGVTVKQFFQSMKANVLLANPQPKTLINKRSSDLLLTLGYDPTKPESILEFISSNVYHLSYEYYGRFIRKGSGHRGLHHGELIYELVEEEGKEDV